MRADSDEARHIAFPKWGKGDRGRGSPKMLAFLGVRGMRWMRLPRDDTVSIPLARSATMFLTAAATGSIEYIIQFTVSGYEFCYRRTL